MRDKFSVGRVDRHWAVFRDGVRVSGLVSHQAIAEERCDAMRRAAMRRDRPCLGCGRSFASEGPHNRMCGRCRTASLEDDLACTAGAWPTRRVG